MNDTQYESEPERTKVPITDCCRAPVTLAFFGRFVCSECRNEWGEDGFGYNAGGGAR